MIEKDYCLVQNATCVAIALQSLGHVTPGVGFGITGEELLAIRKPLAMVNTKVLRLIEAREAATDRDVWGELDKSTAAALYGLKGELAGVDFAGGLRALHRDAEQQRMARCGLMSGSKALTRFAEAMKRLGSMAY